MNLFNIKVILVRSFTVISIMLMTFIVMLYGYNYYLYKTDYSLTLPKNGVFKNERYTWGNLVRNNNFGFRDDFDIKTPKPKNTKRILVLGDSFTWGAGLDVNQRYTNILNKRLNNELLQSINKIEVINAASSGGALVYHRDKLIKILKKVEPDIIFYGFVLNDTQNRGQRYSVEAEQFSQNISPLIKEIEPYLDAIGLNYISRNLYNFAYNVAVNLSIIPHWVVALDRTYDRESQKWKNFETALLQISKIASRENMPPPIMLILNHGPYTDKPTNYRQPDGLLRKWLEWYTQAENAAKEAGFVTSNIQEVLAEEYHSKPMAVNILDSHPNADLNVFYADEAEKLIRNSLGDSWWIKKLL
jgi:lysophospholipase L1-like esterase